MKYKFLLLIFLFSGGLTLIQNLSAQTARIIKTNFPTEDVVVVNYDVTETGFGADPTGSEDATKAIVELRGSSSIPHLDGHQSYGTVLLGYEGAGTENPDSAVAMVTLNGKSYGISGLRFFYPENNPAKVLKPFIDPVTRPSEQLMVISGSEEEQLLNNFAYGSQTGMTIQSGNVKIFNFGTNNLAKEGNTIRIILTTSNLSLITFI